MAKKQAAPVQSTALAPYDPEIEQWAKEAREAVAHVGGGRFISVQGLQFQLDGQPIGKEIVAIVLDSVIANLFFLEKYNADNRQPPVCYSFGREAKTLKVFEEAPQPQHGDCASCPKNQFNSADVGGGKACQNKMRLAILPAGQVDSAGEVTIEQDPDKLASDEFYFYHLPVMSVAPYSAWTKGLYDEHGRAVPPCLVYVKLTVVPDAKSQFKVIAQTICQVPSELVQTVFTRAKAAREAIIFPYPKPQEQGGAAPAPRAPRAPRAPAAPRASTPVPPAPVPKAPPKSTAPKAPPPPPPRSKGPPPAPPKPAGRTAAPAPKY